MGASAIFKPLAEKLQSERAATIVLVNDTGFIGGAGVALRRQAQSFLLAGHNVGVVCWLENPAGAAPPAPHRRSAKGTWLGLRSMPDVHASQGKSESEIAAAVASAVAEFGADLVICGNFHWARWPLEAMRAIRRAGTPVVAYLHDAHWITGRCAYPGACDKFVSGCDAKCPTADEYPKAPPDTIAGNWAERAATFTGEHAIPLAANSRWMAAMAQRRFGEAASVSLVELGVDTHLFAPFDRAAARRLLDLPQDAFVVAMGAVDLSEERKGAGILRRLAPSLAAKGVTVLAFGHNSQYFEAVHGIGHIADERRVPVIMNAADVLVSAAREESFGQTLLEGASCGLPLVAFDSGGMGDIAQHGYNALCAQVSEGGDGLARRVLELRSDAALRTKLGHAGRDLAQMSYSLEAQYGHWKTLVDRLAKQRPGG